MIYIKVVILVFLVIVLIVICKKHNIYEQYNNTITKFQHTNVVITDDTLLYVKLYKKALLYYTIQILDKYNIKYFLSNGNLLEYTRGKTIKQDDDVDIRIYDKDFDKWMKYCMTLKKWENKYVDKDNILLFDDRAHNSNRQLYNGIQITLNVPNIPNNKLNKLHSIYKSVFNNGIHLDLVPSNCEIHKVWKNQSYIFTDKLRKVSYLNTKVSVPSKKMTHIVLTQDYGRDYITPL
tara:strand:+ start:110 stop:814 length:705 start_codon:yes stop_codon:yes gene_type:complete